LRPIFVSACLLGMACRYDSNSKPLVQLTKLLNDQQMIIPFCPEVQGGLETPRSPAEIIKGEGLTVLEGKAKVLSGDGKDVTAEFIRGAEVVFQMADAFNPQLIILKSNSPSCGLGWIYDGSFNGKLKMGDGVAAARLKQGCFQLCTEDEFLGLNFGNN